MAAATYIVPVKLQQFDAAAQPSAPLLYSCKDEVVGDRLVGRAKDTPLSRSIYLLLHFRGQSVAKFSIYQFCIALNFLLDPGRLDIRVSLYLHSDLPCLLRQGHIPLDLPVLLPAFRQYPNPRPEKKAATVH